MKEESYRHTKQAFDSRNMPVVSELPREAVEQGCLPRALQ